MTREEVVLCVDNSEYMRNGDYAPTRMDAQQEAANVICGAKTSQNAENTLAIVSMAAKCPRVEVALTNDLGKLLATLSAIPLSGSANFTISIRVSQLALRRRSSDQAAAAKRIIAFVGSPLRETKEELVALATELLKFNIAVDIVNFGEEVVNTEKLDAFISKLNETEQNSRLVTIPPGPHILSDLILKSPIVLGNAGAAAAAASGNDAMAVDPNMDPELALAIRLSLEEDQRRREREAQQAAPPAASTPAPAAQQQQQPAAQQQQSNAAADDDIYMDDDAALQAALQMSMQQDQQQTPAPAAQQPAPAAQQETKDEEMEDEDLAMALKLSQQQPSGEQKDEDIKDILQDEAFLDKVIGNLGNKKDDKKKDDKQ